MEQELAQNVTNIRSLKAVEIENKANQVSISISDIFDFMLWVQKPMVLFFILIIIPMI